MSTVNQKSYKSGFIFLTTLFFLWGFITVLVDSLVPRLKDVFEMSYAKTVLVQFSFFMAFLFFQFLLDFYYPILDIKKALCWDC